jgi:hypothetical protein
MSGKERALPPTHTPKSTFRVRVKPNEHDHYIGSAQKVDAIGVGGGDGKKYKTISLLEPELNAPRV